MNYDHKVLEYEGLEKEYIEMCEKYDELKNKQRMAEEENDTSDEEFKANLNKQRKLKGLRLQRFQQESQDQRQQINSSLLSLLMLVRLLFLFPIKPNHNA